jgi:hypothetical protein
VLQSLESGTQLVLSSPDAGILEKLKEKLMSSAGEKPDQGPDVSPKA